MNAEQPGAAHVERRVDHQQAEATQDVVHDEQAARVVAVGEDAGADRADDVEHADQGEVPGRRRRADRVVVGGGQEVRLDQPVRREAAHEEAPEQQPERAAAPGVAEGAERGVDGPDVAGRRGGRRRPPSRRTASSPMSSGRSRRKSTTIGTTASAPMAIVTPTHRQPTPSASRDSSGRNTSWPLAVAAVERAGDEAAAGDEPAAGDGRARTRSPCSRTRRRRRRPTAGTAARARSSASCRAHRARSRRGPRR